MTQYQLHDRISATDNHTATIKYIGHLPQWGPQVIAYGIEWDDANRGKNDGLLNGIEYFTPTVANSASFIKSTNRSINHDRKSFIQLIREQYVDAVRYEAKGITFGGKVVEELGWQQLNEHQSQLRNLTSLSLDHLLIYCMAHESDGDYMEDVFSGLHNLTNLDLSSNLFNRMGDIWQIVSRLPNLKILNINGNRFAPDELIRRLDQRFFSHTNLQVLKMASTLIPIHRVNSIISRFPNLQELILSGNYYTNKDTNSLNLSDSKVTALDLSYNYLDQIPFNLSPSILNLNISHCQIISIENSLIKTKIKSLDVRYNQISNWVDIDNLSQSFPQLTNLRINHNPIFENISVDEMTCQLIGRFECDDGNSNGDKLSILNGSKLTLSEIENGELYYISKVHLGQYEMHNSTRWKNLFQKYGKSGHEVKEPSTSSGLKRWINLQLRVRHVNVQKRDIKEDGTGLEGNPHTENDPTVYFHLSTYKFLKTTSILKFKGMISRLFLSNLPILQFRIYYYINEDTNFATKYEFDNWSSCLNDFVLDNHQNIYIDLHHT